MLQFPGLIDVFLAPRGLQFTVERMLLWSREAKEEMGDRMLIGSGLLVPPSAQVSF